MTRREVLFSVALGCFALSCSTTGQRGPVDLVSYHECPDDASEVLGIPDENCVAILATFDIDGWTVNVISSTEDEIRIELISLGEDGTDDARRYYGVDLGEPLSDRTLVDDFDGFEITRVPPS